VSEELTIQPGQEIEVGLASGWRYVVQRSEGGGVFRVIRRSLSLEDHGHRSQMIMVRESFEEAKVAAEEHMERSRRASWGW
jgi:hypothetical protein